MIRWLNIAIARFRYRAVAAELAAAERQQQQCTDYVEQMRERERQEAIALLIAEGGDIAPALKACAQYRLDAPEVVQRKAAAR